MKRDEARQRREDWEKFQDEHEVKYQWFTIYCDRREPFTIKNAPGVRGWIGGLICTFGLKVIGIAPYYVRFRGSPFVNAAGKVLELKKTPGP